MILNDIQIAELAKKGALNPFVPNSESRNDAGKPITSRGLSSFGYDLSLGNVFKTLKVMEKMPGVGHFIDPCNFNKDLLVTTRVEDDGIFVMDPGACVLAVTRERIRIPRDVLVVCMQKSTIARAFLEVTVTPAEPEWEGYLTLELHNKTTFPIHLTPGMGISQMLFFQGDPCDVSYADRGGKYQHQPAEPVPSRSKH